MTPQKPSTARERLELAVVRIAGGDELHVSTTAPTLVVPLESSSVEATCHGRAQQIDRSLCLLVAARTAVTLRGAAPASRAATLAFNAPLFADVARRYASLGLESARFARWVTQGAVLPRTVWLHEIVHRYVFERHALGERDNDTTRFLEIEILKEIYFLFRDREEGVERAARVRMYSRAVERALAYVEEHLFEPCSMAVLAAHAAASESTLLRMFRRELGCTPAAYWRTRVLDEALVLLRGGRHSVAEVASEVGYDNPTAFGHAFRQRFGRPPSAFKQRQPARRAPRA